MTANSDLRDRAVRHALATSGYSRQLSDGIVRLLNGADADLVGRIASGLAGIEDRGVLSKRAMARLEALLDEVRAINAAIYERLHDRLVDDLQDFGEAEAQFHRDSLARALPVGIPDLGVAIPGPIVLKSIVTERPMEGRLLADWTAGMEAGRADRVAQAIRLGMVAGEGTDDIVRRIRGTRAARYSDGVLDISRRSAQSIVRTAVTHVSNQASQETWRANERIVDAWQFLATLDSRTTITCASNDGRTFPIGEGPIPPLHIRCRSISVAVTKSWRELGIDADDVPAPARASMDGQVTGGTTFESWLRNKSSDVQNKVLGRTRADIWRQGKLDLKDFVKNGDTPMTLDQLRAAHKSILG